VKESRGGVTKNQAGQSLRGEEKTILSSSQDGEGRRIDRIRADDSSGGSLLPQLGGDV